MTTHNFEMFENVLMHVRGYFRFAYYAGTREMIYRYVCGKMGDVPPKYVSAALKIMKANNAVIFDKKVWWFLADR